MSHSEVSRPSLSDETRGEKHEPLAVKLTVQEAVMTRLGRLTPSMDPAQQEASFEAWCQSGDSGRFAQLYETEEIQDLLRQNWNLAAEKIAQYFAATQ